MKEKSVLCDTSFIIRLLTDNDPLHDNAYEYYKYFLNREYSLVMSTIAIAEFCVKGKISCLPFNNLKILPFNINHAEKAGSLMNIVFKIKHKEKNFTTQRIIIPNDTKMMAQAEVESDIIHYISSDTEAVKIFKNIDKSNKLSFNYIDIHVPCYEQFGLLF